MAEKTTNQKQYLTRSRKESPTKQKQSETLKSIPSAEKRKSFSHDTSQKTGAILFRKNPQKSAIVKLATEERLPSVEQSPISTNMFYSKKRRLLAQGNTNNNNATASTEKQEQSPDICIPKKERLLQRMTRSSNQTGQVEAPSFKQKLREIRPKPESCQKGDHERKAKEDELKRNPVVIHLARKGRPMQYCKEGEATEIIYIEENEPKESDTSCIIVQPRDTRSKMKTKDDDHQKDTPDKKQADGPTQRLTRSQNLEDVSPAQKSKQGPEQVVDGKALLRQKLANRSFSATPEKEKVHAKTRIATKRTPTPPGMRKAVTTQTDIAKDLDDETGDSFIISVNEAEKDAVDSMIQLRKLRKRSPLKDELTARSPKGAKASFSPKMTGVVKSPNVQASSRQSSSTPSMSRKRPIVPQPSNSDSRLAKHRRLSPEGSTDSSIPSTIVVHIGKDGYVSPKSYQRILVTLGQNSETKSDMKTAQDSGRQKSPRQGSSTSKKKSPQDNSGKKLQTKDASCNTMPVNWSVGSKENASGRNDSQAKPNWNFVPNVNNPKGSTTLKGAQQQRKNQPKGPILQAIPRSTQPVCADYPVIIIQPDSEKDSSNPAITVDGNNARLQNAEICNVQEVLVRGNVDGRPVIRHVLLPVSKTKVTPQVTGHEKPPVEIILPKHMPVMRTGPVIPARERPTPVPAQVVQIPMPDVYQVRTTESRVTEPCQMDVLKETAAQNMRQSQRKSVHSYLQDMDFPQQPFLFASPPAVNKGPKSPNVRAPPRRTESSTISPPSVINEIDDVSPEVAEEFHGGIFLFGAPRSRVQKKISFKSKEKPRNLQEVICMYIDALIQENHELLEVTQNDFPIIPINWDREIYAQEALQRPTEFPSKKLQDFLEQFNIELQVFPHQGQDNLNNNNASSMILHDVRPWMSDDILSLTSESIATKYEAKIKELAAKKTRGRSFKRSLYRDQVLGLPNIEDFESQLEHDPTIILPSDMPPNFEDCITQADVNEANTAVQALLDEEYPTTTFKPFLQDLQSPSVPVLPQHVGDLNSHTGDEVNVPMQDGSASLYAAPLRNVSGLMNTPEVQAPPDMVQHLQMLEANIPEDESDSADEEMRSMSAAITLTNFGMESRLLNSENAIPVSESANNFESGDKYINHGGNRTDLEHDSHAMDLPEEPVPLHIQKKGSSGNTSSMFDLSDDSVDQELMRNFKNGIGPPFRQRCVPQLGNTDGGDKENKVPVPGVWTHGMNHQAMTNKETDSDHIHQMDSNLLWQKQYGSDKSLDPRLSHIQVFSDAFETPRLTAAVLQPVDQNVCTDPCLMTSNDSTVTGQFNGEDAEKENTKMHSSAALDTLHNQSVSAILSQVNNTLSDWTHPSQYDPQNIENNQLGPSDSQMPPVIQYETQHQPEFQVTGSGEVPTGAKLNDSYPSTSEGLNQLFQQSSTSRDKSVPWYHHTPQKVSSLEQSSPLTPNSPTLASVRNIIDAHYKQVFMPDIDADTEDSNQNPRSSCQARIGESQALQIVPILASAATIYENMKTSDASCDQLATEGSDPSEVGVAEAEAFIVEVENQGFATVTVIEKPSEQNQEWAKEVAQQSMEQVTLQSNYSTEEDTCSKSVSDDPEPSQKDAQPVAVSEESNLEEWPNCYQYDASVNQFHGHLQTSVPDEIFDDPSSDTNG